MSGHGSPDLLVPHTPNLRVAIVASQWHATVMNGLIDGAQRACTNAGITPHLIRVPGSFELPVVASAVAPDYDAVVALGVVIRGGTPHFDYVCAAATQGLANAAIQHTTPMGFGLLTCDDEQQALDRAGLADSPEDKGYEAAAAAIVTADIIARERLRSGGSRR